MTTTTEDRAHTQAIAQAESINDLLAAYQMDWDRYQELLDMREEHEADMRESTDPKPFNVAHPDEAEELAELEDIALQADVTSQDEALQRINEDPLSVQVRSDWTDPGYLMEPAEFQILLCTGGPAVRIMGTLDHKGYPDDAWMEYQDWGTSWQTFYGADKGKLLEYASFFLGV